MKIFLTIILLPLILISSAFTVEEKVDWEKENPQWVKDIMDKEPKFTKISKCLNGDEWVWKVNACVTCNDMITKIYDSERNLVCQYGGVLRKNTCNENDIVLEDCRIIYNPTGKLRISF